MDPLKFKTDMAFAYGDPSPMGPGIVRLVAPNPSPLTFKGTNTYLVGSTSLAVIDAGADSEEHRAAILKAAGARPITHILSTHAHRDHVDGVAKLQAETGAVIAAYPRDPVLPEKSRSRTARQANISSIMTSHRILRSRPVTRSRVPTGR